MKYLKVDNAGNVEASGSVTAGSFSGSGVGLTNVPAGQLSGALPALNGALLTNVNAAQLNGQAGSFYQDAGNLNAGYV